MQKWKWQIDKLLLWVLHEVMHAQLTQLTKLVHKFADFGKYDKIPSNPPKQQT